MFALARNLSHFTCVPNFLRFVQFNSTQNLPGSDFLSVGRLIDRNDDTVLASLIPLRNLTLSTLRVTVGELDGHNGCEGGVHFDQYFRLSSVVCRMGTND